MLKKLLKLVLLNENLNIEKEKVTMGTNITREELIARFGYDPTNQNRTYIGEAKAVYGGKIEKFEFYYDPKTGFIDICYFGCNGIEMSGTEISSSETTLPLELERAFFEAKRKTIPPGYDFNKKPHVGKTEVGWHPALAENYPYLKNLKNPTYFDFYYDPRTKSIEIKAAGCSCPAFRGIKLNGGTTLPKEFHDAFLRLI